MSGGPELFLFALVFAIGALPGWALAKLGRRIERGGSEWPGIVGLIPVLLLVTQIAESSLRNSNELPLELVLSAVVWAAIEAAAAAPCIVLVRSLICRLVDRPPLRRGLLLASHGLYALPIAFLVAELFTKAF